jgi:hypothetical protein
VRVVLFLQKKSFFEKDSKTKEPRAKNKEQRLLAEQFKIKDKEIIGLKNNRINEKSLFPALDSFL